MENLANLESIKKIKAKNGTVVEIVQFKELRGSSNLVAAEKLFYANQTNIKLKMVKITIEDSSMRVEPGALYYMRGQLEMKASTGGGIMKGLARKMVSGESFFVNEIHGTGEIYLEPTFGHFLLHELSPEEKGVIVDKSLFYAGTAGLDISAALQKNVSSAFFGGEGFFQTRISGTGIAVLVSPVPKEEIIEYKLTGEKLSVDGNFALMRSDGIKFRAEKSSKSWVATSVSGEGLLQTFEGTGSVWIAPTQGVYKRLGNTIGISNLASAQAKLRTKV